MRNEKEWQPSSSRPPTRRAYIRGLVAAVVLAGTAACTPLTEAPAHAAPPSFPAGGAADGPYSVVKVVDGDTITVRRGGGNVTVRLIGVDTPEVKDPRKPVECFGEEASAETTRLLTGQRVYLEADPGQDQSDRYGRALRYVWTTDHQLVNLHLIEAGFAHEYTYDTPYKYRTEFRAAQNAARDAGRGLWSPSACGR